MPYDEEYSEVDCSELNAVEEQFNKLIKKSFSEIRESGCTICRNKSGELYLSIPSIGTEFKDIGETWTATITMKQECREGDTKIGEMHTHPYNRGDTPSKNDVLNWMNQKKKRLFDSPQTKQEKKNFKWVCIGTMDNNEYYTRCFDMDEALRIHNQKIRSLPAMAYYWTTRTSFIPSCLIRSKAPPSDMEEIIQEREPLLLDLLQIEKQKREKQRKEALKEGKILIELL